MWRVWDSPYRQLCSLFRHRAINLFLKSYKEQWLDTEERDKNILIVDLTVSPICLLDQLIYHKFVHFTPPLLTDKTAQILWIFFLDYFLKQQSLIWGISIVLPWQIIRASLLSYFLTGVNIWKHRIKQIKSSKIVVNHLKREEVGDMYCVPVSDTWINLPLIISFIKL